MTSEPQPDDTAGMDDFERSIQLKDVGPPAWPVFVTFGVMLVVSLVVQVLLVAAWIVWRLANGANLQNLHNDLMDTVTTVEGFVALASSSQFIVGAAAIIGAWFFRAPIGSSLGLGKPALPLWAYPIVIVGALGPGGVGAALATVLAELIPPDESYERVCESLTWVSAGPFLLFISFVPGFVEELFFRGYMQRRLLQAWSAWAAILVTSLLFGIMHFYPHQVVFAFTIGLWLGVLAWRTGSIWPSMLCHAFWNGSATAAVIGLKWAGMEDDPPLIPSVIAGVVVFGCFVASIWILKRQAPPGNTRNIAPEKP